MAMFNFQVGPTQAERLQQRAIEEQQRAQAQQRQNLTAGAASLQQVEPFSPLADPAARFGEQVGLLSQGGPLGMQAGSELLAQQQAVPQPGIDPLQRAFEQKKRALDLEAQGLDIAGKRTSNAASMFELNQKRAQAQMQGQTGFKDANEAIAFGQTLDLLKGPLDAVDQMIKIREDLGAIDITNLVQFPEAAAVVDMFQQFESVNLFKNLSGDTRLSDEDRDFYGSIVDLGLTDWLFTGGKVELAKLKMLQGRLETSMDAYKIHPGAFNFADKFQRTDFGDIGEPFQPRVEETAPALPGVGTFIQQLTGGFGG